MTSIASSTTGGKQNRSTAVKVPKLMTSNSMGLSKEWSVIFSGGFAGMISKTTTAPLERVQIMCQTGLTIFLLSIYQIYGTAILRKNKKTAIFGFCTQKLTKTKYKIQTQTN